MEERVIEAYDRLPGWVCMGMRSAESGYRYSGDNLMGWSFNAVMGSWHPEERKPHERGAVGNVIASEPYYYISRINSMIDLIEGDKVTNPESLERFSSSKVGDLFKFSVSISYDGPPDIISGTGLDNLEAFINLIGSVAKYYNVLRPSLPGVSSFFEESMSLYLFPHDIDVDVFEDASGDYSLSLNSHSLCSSLLTKYPAFFVPSGSDQVLDFEGEYFHGVLSLMSGDIKVYSFYGVVPDLTKRISDLKGIGTYAGNKAHV